MTSDSPDHLPSPLMPDREWNELYQFNSAADDCFASESVWHTIPIPAGLLAKDVYRLIPSAEHFEYGGHLTNSHIHYVKCKELSANSWFSMPCTFHTHPTDVQGTEPDLPSAQDIYSFLKWRHIRTITIGKTLIWVLDKGPKTVPMIKQLAVWEKLNMLHEFRQLERQGSKNPTLDYAAVVLEGLGVSWPRRSVDISENFRAVWPDLLRDTFGIKVTILDR